MDERQIIIWLYETGHFNSPEALQYEITLKDLRGLDLNHPAVMAAVRSIQNLDYNLEYLVRKNHPHRQLNSMGRFSVPDGDVGPATRELLLLPRCEVPDFFAPGDPRGAVIGSGSWPSPCQKAGIKAHVSKGGMPSAIVAKWPEIVHKVFTAYKQVGGNLIETLDKEEAQILIFFGSFFGSTIGIAEFNSQSCSDVVTCKLSSSYVGHNAGLLKHEVGHNFNLGHERGGTMNPSILIEIDNINYRWMPSDPSYKTLKKYLGGEPIDDFPPDFPPPPPTPNFPPNPPGPTPTPTTLWDRILKWFNDNW